MIKAKPVMIAAVHATAAQASIHDFLSASLPARGVNANVKAKAATIRPTPGNASISSSHEPCRPTPVSFGRAVPLTTCDRDHEPAGLSTGLKVRQVRTGAE